MKLLSHAAASFAEWPDRALQSRRAFRENLSGKSFWRAESRSGTGSSLEQTAQLRRELPRLIAETGVRRFLDAPCGDCNWIAELDWSTTDTSASMSCRR